MREGEAERFNESFLHHGNRFITTIISSKSSRMFVLACKETFVLKTLKPVFMDLVYQPEKGIDESIIRNTWMMNMEDRYSSNDGIAAKYKDILVV